MMSSSEEDDKSVAEQAPAMDLATLLREARLNEEKLIHLQAMEEKLLNADSFYEVCNILVEDYRRQFNLRAVTLTLVDQGRQLKEFLEETQPRDSEFNERLSRNVFFIDDYESIKHLETLPREPYVGPAGDEHAQLLGEYAEDVESLALLPLVRREELIGFIALGSVDPQRYSSDMATDFISRLGAIVAVCVQNAIHLERVQLMGLIDSLTQVRNRRYFFKRLGDELHRAQRHEEPLSCLYIDVDHFKTINDQYGHTGGDVALMHAANLLNQAVRESDVVARLGGEEFGVIMPAADEAGARDCAERILELFRQTPCELGRSVRIPMTVSMGSATVNTGDAIAEPSVLSGKLVDQADSALYLAKERGRDQWVAYQSL
ncbi:MAG: DUF484 family protein [Pseudomonadota bacterium]